MNSNKPLPIEPTAVYTATEAADALRVDRTVVYRAYRDGELGGKDMGRGLKFLGSELLKFAGTATLPQDVEKIKSERGAAIQV